MKINRRIQGAIYVAIIVLATSLVTWHLSKKTSRDMVHYFVHRGYTAGFIAGANWHFDCFGGKKPLPGVVPDAAETYFRYIIEQYEKDGKDKWKE